MASSQVTYLGFVTSSQHERGQVLCDHCDAVNTVLVNLMGPKVTDVIMKRVKAALHDPPTDNFDRTHSLDCAIREHR